jgi:hypothetical protein
VRALAVGILWAAATLLTDHGGSLTSSPLWLWGWVLVPVAAALLARTGDEHLAIISAGLCVPMVVAFIARGDPVGDPGPASWPIGALMCLALAAICWAAGRAARRSTSVSRTPDDPEPSA